MAGEVGLEGLDAHSHGGLEMRVKSSDIWKVDNDMLGEQAELQEVLIPGDQPCRSHRTCTRLAQSGTGTGTVDCTRTRLSVATHVGGTSSSKEPVCLSTESRRKSPEILSKNVWKCEAGEAVWCQ